jgi:uncharacterized protein
MLLDLSEIVMRSGMHVGLDLDEPGVEDPDLVFQEPMRGHLDFDNGGEVLSIHGNVKTAVTIPCARCLAEVRVPVDLQVEEHFPIEDVLHPKRQPEEGAEYDTTVSSVVYIEQGRPMLDLDELLRQLTLAELPIQTLCREECAGICARCGANRNEHPCACEDEPVNTPLAGLAALLEQQQEDSV